MKKLLNIFIVQLLFLCIFAAGSYLKPVSAYHGATGLNFLEEFQECIGGSVRASFTWTPIPPSYYAIIDGQWLDVSLDPGMGSVFGANVLGNASYTTTTAIGEHIGHLTPNELHYWRINTHIAGESPTTWHTSAVLPFLTMSCDGDPPTVNIIVPNLQASFVDVGPGLFTWTPSGSTAGRLFIGTNSTNPVVGSTISYAVNTADGSLGVPQPPVGVYYAAMYTGAFGEIRMSNIVSFAIGAAGDITMNQPTISGNTVIFTFTPSDGAFVVIADTICPAMSSLNRPYDSGQLAPGVTQATKSGLAVGIYCAKIVKALSGETLSNIVNFEVLTGAVTGGTPDCGGFINCLSTIKSPTTAFTEDGLLGAIFTSILPIIIGLGGFLTVIIIVISGIQFVTSSGNPEAAGAAKGRLTYAIIGFILIITAYAITKIIDTLFLGGSGII
jgi:hypothetical protein